MKRTFLILGISLIVLFVVCLLAGLSVSKSATYCITGGVIGVLISIVTAKASEPSRFQMKHPLSFLLILQVLTASCALIGMIAEIQLLKHFGYSPGSLTLLLWPLAVFIALLVMASSALESLQTTGRRVTAYGMAVVISMAHTYWHVFYLINKFGT
jgi:hypothetical protein